MTASVVRAIPPSPHTRADRVWEEFVRHRFELSPTAAEGIRRKPWSFGFGGFSEAVYFDHYSRVMSDGRRETWPDTVLRCVNGVMSVRKNHYVRNRLDWDEGRWQEVAAEMAEHFLALRCSPPGRGIFAMGTDLVYRRLAASLNNCASKKVRPETLDYDLGWVADMLLHACGVGVECVPQRCFLHQPSGGPVLYTIPDSREGWVESIELLLRSYVRGSERVQFDYSELRPAGVPLATFGGHASGPEPLEKLHARLRSYCERFIRGESSWVRLVADAANAIGACVVAGGTRRSSMILIGSPDDPEFLDLKDYERHPERAEVGWASNNSVRFSESRHFELIPEIAARMRVNGEPGWINQIAMQKFARFGREKPDAADMTNPCQPSWATLLTPQGIRTMGEISVGDLIWSGKRWTKVARKVSTGVKKVFAYRTMVGTFYGTPNHRVVSGGEKVHAAEASGIDWGWSCRREFQSCSPLYPHEGCPRERSFTASVMSVTLVGDMEVFDITVEDEEHTYWTDGLLVSNCGEQPLEDAELCCLADVYPSRCRDAGEVIRAQEIAGIFASTVSLLPTHRADTNRVMARNRRIGVSMSGVADWMGKVSAAEMTRTMRRAYSALVKVNADLAEEAGVRPAIRVSTSKPGGTTALLPGVSPGGHFALFEHYIRRKRVAVNSPVHRLLVEAGYPHEKDSYANATDVFEFPISQPGVRTQTQAGMHEQALQAVMLQREHSDNAVSYTITFDKQEGERLGNMLAQVAPMLKSVSCLPREEHGYKQPPYEPITREEFERRAAAVRPIDWAAFAEARGDAVEADKFCSSGVCEVKSRGKEEKK